MVLCLCVENVELQVIPEMRDACARVRGLCVINFSLSSADKNENFK